MTKDKQLKKKARELAAEKGISYTAARRLLTDEPNRKKDR